MVVATVMMNCLISSSVLAVSASSSSPTKTGFNDLADAICRSRFIIWEVSVAVYRDARSYIEDGMEATNLHGQINIRRVGEPAGVDDRLNGGIARVNGHSASRERCNETGKESNIVLSGLGARVLDVADHVLDLWPVRSKGIQILERRILQILAELLG